MGFDFDKDKYAEIGNTAKKRDSEMNYDLWALAHTEPEQSKTSRFITISMIVHAALLLGVAMLTVPLVEEAKVETVTIEIAEPVRHMARGHNVPLTQGRAEPVVEPKADATPAGKDDVVVASPKAAKAAARAAAKAAKVAAAKPARARAHFAKASSHPIPVAHAVKVAPPAAPKLATIDDIDAPDVDKSTEDVAHSWTPSAYSDDIDQDLDKVDRSQTQKLAAEKNRLDQEANAVDAENEKALQDADADTKAEQAAIAAANEARRKRDGQAIADAEAGENAERAAAAARAAAAEKAGREAAARQKALASRSRGNGVGNGAGNQGAPVAGVASGVPNGVRSLDQLRQRPGNPIPQYATSERLRRQQGQVTYHAYVKKDGSLTSFRQLSSTGYSNLDSKTLAALQKWKFYPGQEGWVELPFRWDIKGGAQSVDGMLRTHRGDISRR